MEGSEKQRTDSSVLSRNEPHPGGLLGDLYSHFLLVTAKKPRKLHKSTLVS